VQLYFRGEKMAKVMGSLAMQKPVEGMPVSGILVKRNFNYHILAPADLPKYTDLTMSTVTQVRIRAFQFCQLLAVFGKNI
jgi:cleavage and polyadenylation specificity factor subunit 3